MKKKTASTGSVGNLPPRLNKRPGPPQPYVRRKSAPPAIEAIEATTVLEPPSSSKGDSTTIAKVEFLATENGQKLSTLEIYAYADAVAFRRTVGAIYTNKKHEVVVEPIKGETKPAGPSLNDVTAWTSFALSDEADLFGEETDAMLHDSGNKKANDKSKIGAFARFIRDATEAHWDPVVDNKSGVKAAGKLGKNKPTEMFRSLAHRCAFANPDRFTARSARRTGITLLCKSGINQHLINAKARHSDTATNALYCDPHSDEYAEAAVALHYKPAGEYIVVDSILDTFVYSPL